MCGSQIALLLFLWFSESRKSVYCVVRSEPLSTIQINVSAYIANLSTLMQVTRESFRMSLNILYINRHFISTLCVTLQMY